MEEALTSEQTTPSTHMTYLSEDAVEIIIRERMLLAFTAADENPLATLPHINIKADCGIWVCLDEGSNSNCHEEEWARNIENVFNHINNVFQGSHLAYRRLEAVCCVPVGQQRQDLAWISCEMGTTWEKTPGVAV